MGHGAAMSVRVLIGDGHRGGLLPDEALTFGKNLADRPSPLNQGRARRPPVTRVSVVTIRHAQDSCRRKIREGTALAPALRTARTIS